MSLSGVIRKDWWIIELLDILNPVAGKIMMWQKVFCFFFLQTSKAYDLFNWTMRTVKRTKAIKSITAAFRLSFNAKGKREKIVYSNTLLHLTCCHLRPERDAQAVFFSSFFYQKYYVLARMHNEYLFNIFLFSFSLSIHPFSHF